MQLGTETHLPITVFKVGGWVVIAPEKKKIRGTPGARPDQEQPGWALGLKWEGLCSILQ